MKAYREIMRIIVSSVGAGLVIPFSELFQNHFDNWTAVILAAVVSAGIIYFGSLIFIEIPYLFRRFRQAFLKISEMEGVWVEVATSGERVISIAHIVYEPFRKKHRYYGYAYDKNGTLKASWNANHLSHEEGDNIHSFTFTGGGEYIMEHKQIRVVGQVNFRSADPLHPNNLTTGHGAYYDYDVGAENPAAGEARNTFEIFKLTASDYEQHLGRKKRISSDAWKTFVINYYKNYYQQTTVQNVAT
jgi:hypothetical protein